MQEYWQNNSDILMVGDLLEDLDADGRIHWRFVVNTVMRLGLRTN